MESTLFNIEDYTETSVRKIMQGKTCRQCAHRLRHQYNKSTFYCDAHQSGRTICKMLKVKANQPACIRFENINNLNK